MKEKHISIKELSNRIGIDRSNVLKLLKKSGIKTQNRRMPDSRNQLCSTITKEQANEIIAHRKEIGFLNSGKSVDSEIGFFYIVQLIPEFTLSRIKLGFSNDVSNRLAQFRTVVPKAKILKTWPCRRSWEQTITDALVSKNCKHINNEIYDCDDIDSLLKRADEFFEFFPNLTKK